jgi:hypothetical protein
MRLVLAALLVAACAGYGDGEESPLSWINAARRAAGAANVRPDPVLSITAQTWATALAAAGTLTHRGAGGSSALDRYRAQGGTEARVGEIIGSGGSLAAVEAGWLASAEHKRLIGEASWTHAGWGSASFGSSEVWVIIFCQRLVEDLSVDRDGSGLTVAGTFIPRDADRALLYAGLDPVAPSAWDPVSRRFVFSVPREQSSGYFRLGYVTAAGGFRLTNAFTLPPGMGSPGGPGRSEAPGRSP